MPPSLQQQINALSARMDAADKTREETHAMVATMYHALMEPQIGQGDKSLVERMASVTVDIESGKRSADNLIAIARRLVAIGAALATIGALFAGAWAAMKLGHLPGDKP